MRAVSFYACDLQVVTERYRHKHGSENGAQWRFHGRAVWRSIPLMDVANVNLERSFFKVLQTSKKSQTAVMTLPPGKSSGPRGNEHPRCEQVLLVLEGEVLAEIGDEKRTLRKGDVAIVTLGAAHRFRNCAESAAVTFNVYAPPAYDPGEAG